MRTLFIARCQLPVTHGFIRIASIVIHAFERAATHGGFGKTMKPGMKRSQALVQARITWSLGQSAQQWHDRFIREIIRKEEIRIGDRRTYGDRDVVRDRPDQ